MIGRSLLALVAVLGAVLLLAAPGGAVRTPQTSQPQHASSPTASPTVATTGAPAPLGTFTLLDGAQTNVTAYRGHPELVWFVANGCSSCAASIPAMAKKLPAFRAAKATVVVLGLYGSFASTVQGRSRLANFGKEYAGSAFADRTWVWGVASLHTTEAYDPAGIPDEYFLLNSAGDVTYEGSVPVSTMSSLLGHLRKLRTTSATKGSPMTSGLQPGRHSSQATAALHTARAST